MEQLTEKFLKRYFQSKKEMAERMGIPYRTLLSACEGNGNRQTTENVVGCILRYCIREHIPLNDIFPPKAI